ncbi:Glycosyltransferase involved in cell wall bisynthesis [Flavobacterium resistens]|nr:glycosyltransferase [Flavobacterium resistens]SMO86531.1 Glycosyltransferase involved in cell wall bisynthesis [Flavobacterium resistens]
MSTKLSIIIPCYNSESTLETTLKSVLNQEFQEWEAIMVNDGSPDNLEAIALKYVEKDTRFTYFKKENGGLGSARNYGIKKAKGEFILPLDSDNQVTENFAIDAMSIFDKDQNIGVVYGNAEFYGEKTGLWKVDEFSLDKMLVHNYIDACAIFKKSLWQKVGGYDENMPYQGHEDWEFWVSLAELKVKFYYLDKITFKYYVSSTSMSKSFTDEVILLNQDYIVKKHSRLFYDHYCQVLDYPAVLKRNYSNKLKSKKVIVDLFCKTFFKFSLFKTEFDNF